MFVNLIDSFIFCCKIRKRYNVYEISRAGLVCFLKSIEKLLLALYINKNLDLDNMVLTQSIFILDNIL